MTKEFKINDILNAVNSISKIERKEGKNIKIQNNYNDKSDILHANKQVKSNKSEVLVLDQMIE